MWGSDQLSRKELDHLVPAVCRGTMEKLHGLNLHAISICFFYLISLKIEIADGKFRVACIQNVKSYKAVLNDMICVIRNTVFNTIAL